jgi:hypothetical protein
MAAESSGNRESRSSSSTEELSAALGVEITEEGKARARRKLDEAAARMTPERWNANRQQLHMAPKTSAA